MEKRNLCNYTPRLLQKGTIITRCKKGRIQFRRSQNDARNATKLINNSKEKDSRCKISLLFGLHLVLSFCLGTALEFIRVFPDLPQDNPKATTFTLVSVSQLQTMYFIIGAKR